jgi:hypothetical protein
MDLNLAENEKYIFLHMMYAGRATMLGIKHKDFYQNSLDNMFFEDVLTNDVITEERFLELVHFIEQENEKALQMLIELRKNPEYVFPYTKDWDLKLPEVI